MKHILTAAVLLLAAAPAPAQVAITLDSKVHAPGAATVDVDLEAGCYRVTAVGGAWNAWSTVAGCDGAGESCAFGWWTAFWHFAPGEFSMAGGGGPGGFHATPAGALADSQPSDFVLMSAGTVSFGVVDQPLALADNSGTLDLLITPITGSAPGIEVVRAGTPPNPVALSGGLTSGPVLGAVWDPVIAHTTFVPDALLDVLAIAPLAANLPSAIGTVLCDPTAPLLFVSDPGIPFEVPLPHRCGLVGVQVCAQGASVTASGTVSLTNALDLTLGTF